MSIDLDSKRVLFVCGILGMYVYDTIIKPNLRSK